MDRSEKMLYWIYFLSVIIFISVPLAVCILMTENIILFLIMALSAILIIISSFIFLKIFRSKISGFANNTVKIIDDMISENENIEFRYTKEELYDKINIKLKRLYEILTDKEKATMAEKQIVQSLISDISHQVKTPVANIKMYNSIIRERNMSKEKINEFLDISDIQADRLEFLISSMIKMSRLESGTINFLSKYQPICETTADALSEILIKADSKNIDISVDIAQDIKVTHDRKWTSEAIYNILDNAVKYTDSGGKIKISAQKQEFYTQLSIKDNGMGISEKEQASIFKRFYRSPEVHEYDGIGIGLYLVREIITCQGGYVTIKSEPGRGSEFSIFMPN